jgi:hypothetical protein
MDTIIALQETKKVKRTVGETSLLKTSSKIIVPAINELFDRTEKQLELYETTVAAVAQNEVRTKWMPFINSGFIKGIKCTGEEHTGNFELSLFTKPQNNGGKYVYKSGTINKVSWDIMDIPYHDESGTNDLYIVLENKGAITTFNIQIYVVKG